MPGEEQEEVEEDDWSSFMCAQQADTGFARHEERSLSISDDKELRIKCVTALSPLDMINMYHGSQDATGNRIWTGALLFLEAFARPLPSVLSPREDKEHQPRACTASSSRLQDSRVTSSAIGSTVRQRLSKLRTRAIENKKILEMGAGTGISGLSILLSDEYSPTHVTLTDLDPAALDLCRKNCVLNAKDTDRYIIQQLIWGAELINEISRASYDTVIATDVLYDIASLPPLMQTASALLKEKGYFLLSHVPRASVQRSDGEEGGSAVANAEVLTKVIVEEASNHKLYLDSSNLSTIGPMDLSMLWDRALNEASFADMAGIDATVFVFRKKVPEF